MDQVASPSFRIKLNIDVRDLAGQGLKHNFGLVKEFLGDTLHEHNLKDPRFPHSLQTDLLVEMNWGGWALLEASDQVPDRLRALVEQRELWNQMLGHHTRIDSAYTPSSSPGHPTQGGATAWLPAGE